MTSDLRKDIKKAWRTVQDRENAPYDGVMGTPPEIIPKKFRWEFESKRNWLLGEGYSHQQILEWIKERSAPLPEYSRNVFYCPWDVHLDDKIRDCINFLTVIYVASDLKTEEEVIAFLIDEQIAENTLYGKAQKASRKKATNKARIVNTKRAKNLEKRCLELAEEELGTRIIPVKTLVPKIIAKLTKEGLTLNGKPYSPSRISNILSGKIRVIKKKVFLNKSLPKFPPINPQ